MSRAAITVGSGQDDRAVAGAWLHAAAKPSRDEERLRLAAMKRARKVLRQAKGMHHG